MLKGLAITDKLYGYSVDYYDGGKGIVIADSEEDAKNKIINGYLKHGYSKSELTDLEVWRVNKPFDDTLDRNLAIDFERMVSIMRLHLFWIDKKWGERGYANNYNLIVDMGKKIYKVYTNSFYAYHRVEDIEVKRKSDITDYIECLKENGFTEVENI